MTCATCADKGITQANWANAPQDYCLCLCKAGQAMRKDENNGKRVTPRWMLWCSMQQVEPSRLFLIEEVLTAEELAERGFSKPAGVDREAALLAGRRRQT